MNSHSPSVHSRYEQIRELGRGGAGAVYLVRDRETGEQLALKRLLHADTQSMLRLKREFRFLADVHHPNLVKLYELGHDQTSAYFTMEYLKGQELKAYLDYDPASSIAANDNGDAAHRARVLSAFQQLGSAVCALHRAGVLHRDLKPNNVMVADGRVVVLDFGIALEVGADAATVTQDQLGSGTPAYMAPELLQGEHLGEPNDWYAFGVMLYEALSGSLPIEGGLIEMLQRKQMDEPIPIDALVDDLPRDLAELCMGLLRRAPGERPGGEQVMNVLREHAASALVNATASLSAGLPSLTGDDELSLFGREQELAALRSAFRSVQAAGFAVVHVFGESGSGKSLLAQHFTDEVERHAGSGLTAQPMVLRSRCHERESLPFKALDGAMDALVSQLMRESEVVVGHVLPRDLNALSQLFPALSRLPAVQQLLDRARPLGGTSQARAQAEAALYDLLRRLANHRPIVLWIDDLQWGDLDSTGILLSWLKPPRLPHLLLMLSYRSEEISTSPCLTLLRQRGVDDPSIETMVAVGTLGEAHVRALCKQLFAHAGLSAPAQSAVIERIVHEAQGSPFLASQLAALAVTQPNSGEAQLASLTLQQLVRSRSSTLSSGARTVLQVLSVAGRPTSVGLALRAAGVEREGRAALHELQTLHLIRSRDSAGERLLEVYHDRLREAVESSLTREEHLELDRRLLAALRDLGSTDMDQLHGLALAVGDREAALRYGLAAAERAGSMLAFERAAELYARCIELSADPAADGGSLWEKLALAYARAGHGSKAAATYLSAAQQVDPELALQFERAAASHLLCSGRYDEGEALLRKVLAQLQLEPPSSELGLYAALAWEHARLAVRGLHYTPRARSEIPFSVFYSGVLCGMVSLETAIYDPLRAALFQARCLRMALDAGDPESVARAMLTAATMSAVSGSERGSRRADQFVARAEAISGTLDSTLLRTNIASARAVCAFLTGRIAESVELCAQAEYLHRTSTVDSEYHHRFTIASGRICALLQLGEYQRAEAELQIYLKEAAATENISAELHITMAEAWADIIAARSEHAIARLDRQRAQLPRQGYGLLHVLHMIAVLRVGCDTGEYEWALSGTHDHWQAFQRSVVRRSESFSMFVYEVHARLLLNRCVRDGTREHGARQVAPDLKALGGLKRGDAQAERTRIQARLAWLANDTASAQRQLEKSSAGFEAYGARDQAARDRYALGALVGGEQGSAWMSQAIALLRELGVADPRRDLRGHFPEAFEAQP